jgi:hypothetical protein
MSQHLSRAFGWLRRASTRVHLEKIEEKSESKPGLRYAACGILSDAGVTYCIWAEDTLLSYGVPTVTFDLFLLVRDPNEAAEILKAAGYVREKPNPRYLNISQFSDRFGPERPSEPTNEPREGSELYESADPALNAVILLPAKQWNYELPHDAPILDKSVPPLPKFLDALIMTWLDVPNVEWPFRMHIATHIGYIYYYVEGVKAPRFEEGLRKEHRQFHFDQLAGIYSDELISSRCQSHYQAIRSKILSGEMEPHASPVPVREEAMTQ